MNRLEEIKQKFRILDDWTIIIGSDRRLDKTSYTGECTFNLDRHTAVIYRWHINRTEPIDYILHETLHIALRIALIDREHEELFVQDLCTQLEEKDREIERLKKENEWLIDGWAKDKSYINNLWAAGKSKKEMIKKVQQELQELP